MIGFVIFLSCLWGLLSGLLYEKNTIGGRIKKRATDSSKLCYKAVSPLVYSVDVFPSTVSRSFTKWESRGWQQVTRFLEISGSVFESTTIFFSALFLDRWSRLNLDWDLPSGKVLLHWSYQGKNISNTPLFILCNVPKEIRSKCLGKISIYKSQYNVNSVY